MAGRRLPFGGREVGLLVAEHMEQGKGFAIREAEHSRVVALTIRSFVRVAPFAECEVRDVVWRDVVWRDVVRMVQTSNTHKSGRISGT